jgi:CheY-like chemotaxis protein
MTRNVISVVDDMFFASKIRATAEALGVNISFVRSQESLLQKARELKPDLVVVDLHNQKLSAADVAEAIRGDDELHEIWLLGFFSHVEVELQRAAVAAGFNQVIPRSVFASELGKILAGE